MINFKRNQREKYMPEAFDVSTLEVPAHDIEEQIATELQRSRGTMRLLEPGIEFVPPSDIGQLSAAAVEEMYQSAAKAIEAMGVDLIDTARRAEAMAADIKTALEFIRETADKYRAEATKIGDRIRAANEMTNAVREACEDMRTKINLAAPAPE